MHSFIWVSINNSSENNKGNLKLTSKSILIRSITKKKIKSCEKLYLVSGVESNFCGFEYEE